MYCLLGRERVVITFESEAMCFQVETNDECRKKIGEVLTLVISMIKEKYAYHYIGKGPALWIRAHDTRACLMHFLFYCLRLLKL